MGYYKFDFIYSQNWTPSGLLNLRGVFSKCSDFVSIFYNSFLSSFYFIWNGYFKYIRFFFFWFLIFEVLIFLFPYVLGDPENFLFANSLSTPAHIVPEWYFLFAYAILRSIPRKLGGVISLVLAVL